MNLPSHTLMRTLALLFIAASACAAQSTKSAKASKATAQPAPAVRTASQQELPALSTRIRTLRAVPTRISMHVGQTIDLDSIRVIAVDADGHDVARLPGFDFVIKPGEAVSVVPRTLRAERVGEATLTVRYPNAAWGKRIEVRPSTTVHLVVTK
jgi:hypothetical protein